MATAEKIERGYLGSLLRLTLLAPDIVEAVLDRGLSDRFGLPALLQPFPTNWAEQRVCSAAIDRAAFDNRSC